MRHIAIVLALLSFLLVRSADANPPIVVESYEEALEHEGRNILVVFGTEWCSHCKELKGDLPSMDLGGWVVCTVDADKRKDLRRDHKVRSYPTSVVIRDKEEVARMVGYERSSYEAWLAANGPK